MKALCCFETSGTDYPVTRRQSLEEGLLGVFFTCMCHLTLQDLFLNLKLIVCRYIDMNIAGCILT